MDNTTLDSLVPVTITLRMTDGTEQRIQHQIELRTVLQLAILSDISQSLIQPTLSLTGSTLSPQRTRSEIRKQRRKRRLKRLRRMCRPLPYY